MTATAARAEIEAARQAWVAACCALAAHIDPEAEPAPCPACLLEEDCPTAALLEAAEVQAFKGYERTKGGHRGYL